MSSSKHPWFVRRNQNPEKIEGPYPAGLISRYLLLGRLKLWDELSEDREHWAPISQFPDLIPDLLKADPEDRFVQERIEAARRWEDERSGENRRGQGTEQEVEVDRRRARVGDRRRGEDEQTAEQRRRRLERMEHMRRRQQHRERVANVILTVVILGGIGLAWRYWPEPVVQSTRDCQAPPGPGINWTNCQKDGLNLGKVDLREANLSNVRLSNSSLAGAVLSHANVAFADLSASDLRSTRLIGANLQGVNLRGAKLAGADLSLADLSYADLTGADLTGATLNGTKMHKAKWIDGRLCMPGSVGGCLLPK